MTLYFKESEIVPSPEVLSNKYLKFPPLVFQHTTIPFYFHLCICNKTLLLKLPLLNGKALFSIFLSHIKSFFLKFNFLLVFFREYISPINFDVLVKEMLSFYCYYDQQVIFSIIEKHFQLIFLISHLLCHYLQTIKSSMLILLIAYLIFHPLLQNSLFSLLCMLRLFGLSKRSSLNTQFKTNLMSLTSSEHNREFGIPSG